MGNWSLVVGPFLIIQEAETTQMHGTDSKNLFSWAISITENIASQRHFPKQISEGGPKFLKTGDGCTIEATNISSYN